MAFSNVTLTEYSSPGFFAGQVPAAQLPENKVTTLLSSSTSQTLATLQPTTRLIRMGVDNTASGLGVCFATGTSPTASTTGPRLAVNQTEYFTISEATVGTLKVAVIGANN